MKSLPTTTRIVVIVLVVGAVLRVAANLHLGIAAPPVSDAVEYDRIAKNLLAGKGYVGISWGNPQEHVTAYRVPLYTAVWAACLWLFGERYEMLRLANVACDLISIGLLFVIGRRLFGQRAGLVAAGWYALYPIAVLMTWALAAETMFVTLQLFLVWLCLRGAERPDWRTFGAAGIVAGLGTLTRPNMLLTLPLLVVWSLIVFWGKWPAFARSLLVFAVALLVVAPWTYRNYRVFGRFIPVTSQSGANLLMGNNPRVVTEPKYFGREVYQHEIPGFSEQLEGLPEAELDAKAGQLAVAWLKANPDKWAFLAWEKFKAYCSPFTRGPDRARRLVMLVSWGPVFVLGLPALLVCGWRYLRDRHAGLLLHLIIVSTVTGIVLVFFNFRYRFPSEPIWILFASATTMWLADRVRQLKGGS